jgi:hypothetical protein
MCCQRADFKPVRVSSYGGVSESPRLRVDGINDPISPPAQTDVLVAESCCAPRNIEIFLNGGAQPPREEVFFWRGGEAPGLLSRHWKAYLLLPAPPTVVFRHVPTLTTK